MAELGYRFGLHTLTKVCVSSTGFEVCIPRGIRGCSEELREKGVNQLSFTCHVYQASAEDVNHRRALPAFMSLKPMFQNKGIKETLLSFFLNQVPIFSPQTPQWGLVLCPVAPCFPKLDQLEWGRGPLFHLLSESQVSLSCLMIPAWWKMCRILRKSLSPPELTKPYDSG